MSTGTIVILLFLADAACAVVTGFLFRRSGRSAFAGCLTGFFFTWMGVILGLTLLAKGPPKPKPPSVTEYLPGTNIPVTLALYRHVYNTPQNLAAGRKIPSAGGPQRGPGQ